METQDTDLITQRLNAIHTFEASVKPPFPKNIMVELTNVCNHGCVFCAYPKQTRPKKQADVALMERVIKEAYDNGAREIGLHSGTEPYASKQLEHFIKYSKEIGYEYIYLSTNGALATPARLKNSVDLGLNSIKFSVNAGNREAYKIVHGKDDFDKVISHIKYLAQYRKESQKKIYASLSYVDCKENAGQFEQLKEILKDDLDEFIFVPAINQGGQKPEYDIPLGKVIKTSTKTLSYAYVKTPCPLPFNRLHVSAEGHLRACCNDYQNYLAIENLEGKSIKDAFYSEKFTELRRKHLEHDISGLMCMNCLYGQNSKPVEPINKELATEVPASYFLSEPPSFPEPQNNS